MTQEAAFVTVGGQSTIACGSMLTKLLKGMSLAEAGQVRPEELIYALDGLPTKTHWTRLILNTLGQVIQLYGAGRDTVS